MKRIISVLLAVIFVISAFASCDSQSGEIKEEKVQINKTEITFSDYTEYALVKPYSGTDAELALSMQVFNAVKNFLNTEITLCTDMKENDENTLEILVGNTTHSPSKTVAKALRVNDYYIGTCDGAIVILGGSDEATKIAVEKFISEYESVFASGKFTPDNCVHFEDEYAVTSAYIGKHPITDYSIVYHEGDIDGEYYADEVRDYISTNFNYPLAVYDDSEQEQDCEILIGQTDREESPKEEVKVYQSEIKLTGTKLTFNFGGLWAMLQTLPHLSDYVTDGKFKLEKDFSLSLDKLSVRESESPFVYITSKGLDGDTPVGEITIGTTPIDKYVIVYHDYGEGYTGYGENEMFAASELQKYIEYACGKKLPLVKDTEAEAEYEIVVGNTERTKITPELADSYYFGDEGLLIESKGNDIILRGGEVRGTLYAVYTFLEDYIGCRFFANDCEVIYKADKVEIPTDILVVQQSPFEYRDNSTFSTLSANIAPKLKYNSCYRRNLDNAHGGSVEFLNGTDGFVHTMSKYLDLGSEDRQPCLTDEKTYEKAIAKIRDILNGTQEPYIISVTQNDNDNPCQCKDCAKVNREEGSDAGTIIRFVNRIAEDLKDDYPNVKVMTLAYMYTEEPTKTAPADNVIVELCNYEECLAHVDGTCEGNSDFYSYMEGWLELTDNLYIWNYACDFEKKYEKTPYMNFDTLYYNNRQFAEMGIKGIFHEGTTETYGKEFGELRAYLLAKIMWNPEITIEEYHEMAHEFITAYYGPISDMVINYFDFLNSISGEYDYDLYCAPESVLDQTLFSEFSHELATWWETASVIEKTNQDTKRHCGYLKEGFDFLYDELRFNDFE